MLKKKKKKLNKKTRPTNPIGFIHETNISEHWVIRYNGGEKQTVLALLEPTWMGNKMLTEQNNEHKI